MRVVGACLIGLGLSVVSPAVTSALLPASSAQPVGSLLVWTFLAVPVVMALSRSVPRGLFRFRPVDVLYGLVLGALLRMIQGAAVKVSSGDPAPVPSYPRVDGVFPLERFLADAFGPALTGSIVEELFFRCALLVAIYTVVRRRWGVVAGSWIAVAATTVAFVTAHALVAPVSVDHAVALGLLGVVCGLLVIRTGRIWGAILTHITFNAILVLLTAAGTVLAG